MTEANNLMSTIPEGAQIQDATTSEYNGNQKNSAGSNTVTVQGKSVSVTGKKRAAEHARPLLKSSLGRKPRPIPMLQCIQQSGKMDSNSVVPMSVDRDGDEGGGNESNVLSVIPDHVSGHKTLYSLWLHIDVCY
jgi:hypothetical protein